MALPSLSLQLVKMLRSIPSARYPAMMKLTLMVVAIAGLGEDVKNETSNAPLSALIVMNDEIEARASLAPLPQYLHPMLQASHARLRPVCPRTRPRQRNTMTCHLKQAAPETATQHLRLKLRRRTYRSSVDSAVPQLGRTPRRSVGRVVRHASRFLSWSRLNDANQGNCAFERLR